ncbi:hypothetical protein OH76DRAFT_246064 [Lentinus brumalis]|uniref:Uncharacterized protein n=1 Tax=Lentinus brumalis TaxID=2498619 RepID=A0A371CLU6_9APHY|nr:hypothetical protein OH76DRAFT_246064 [Polyporus brumalis]
MRSSAQEHRSEDRANECHSGVVLVKCRDHSIEIVKHSRISGGVAHEAAMVVPGGIVTTGIGPYHPPEQARNIRKYVFLVPVQNNLVTGPERRIQQVVTPKVPISTGYLYGLQRFRSDFQSCSGPEQETNSGDIPGLVVRAIARRVCRLSSAIVTVVAEENSNCDLSAISDATFTIASTTSWHPRTVQH